MAFEYFPAAADAEQKPIDPPKSNWLPMVALLLLLALSFTIGYIIWDKNKTVPAAKQSPENKLVAATNPVVIESNIVKDSLRKALFDITSRYDQLKTISNNATGMLSEKDAAIAAKANEIRELLSKMNANDDELKEARRMIALLTTEIEKFKVQVETLKGEKIILSEEKILAAQQRDAAKKNYDSAMQALRRKDDIIDIATTLNASNFNITSIHQKTNGEEVTTVVAKMVDKMRISFDIAENHVAQSGTKELFVCITGPDGTAISVEALGSGKFTTRNGEEKFYTQKMDINYVQGNRQTVSFDWRQNSVFETGAYKIQVFNNGFRIGEGVRLLRKS